ncbi:hypothetical protein HYY71_06935 [Candidatus Woesearchaeota archaeon]|nr:hypothetical protein [Candidatus Woesearchaeota archaeon]
MPEIDFIVVHNLEDNEVARALDHAASYEVVTIKELRRRMGEIGAESLVSRLTFDPAKPTPQIIASLRKAVAYPIGPDDISIDMHKQVRVPKYV